MPEIIDESSALESTTVGVYRTAATVKGGRRFSFGALVVVGDRSGRLGIGYAKANQVPPAIEKAQKEARRKMRFFVLQGRTLPHAVTGRFGACTVRLLPASPGTGVIAGAAVRAPLEMLGVQDCLTKSFGSTNPKNLVKAVIAGLEQLRTRSTVEALRGVELGPTTVEEVIRKGQAYVTAAPAPRRERDAGHAGHAGSRGPAGASRRRKRKSQDEGAGQSGDHEAAADQPSQEPQA